MHPNIAADSVRVAPTHPFCSHNRRLWNALQRFRATY